VHITIDDISKFFGKTCAVNHVSLDIPTGEFFFLLGSSGCGKTTLLRMIAGLEMPDSGRILLGDRDVSTVPTHKRNTAMVFQGYALWPHMTVAQNVAFGLETRGVAKDERERRVCEALELVRISELSTRKPNELSGGQQQRVALARTIVVSPGCLLLDEPLANLDAKLRLEMRREIRRICKETGLSAVYVTHDQKEALSMADRMAVMDKGRVIQLGTPRAVYTRPVNAFVSAFIGETNLLRGKITVQAGGEVSVATELGTMRSTVPPADGHIGTDVQVSIRPEAFVVADDDTHPGPESIRCTIRESVYLGEMSQYVLAAEHGIELRVHELNPKTPRPNGSSVQLTVDPGDVVVLRD